MKLRATHLYVQLFLRNKGVFGKVWFNGMTKMNSIPSKFMGSCPFKGDKSRMQNYVFHLEDLYLKKKV